MLDSLKVTTPMTLYHLNDYFFQLSATKLPTKNSLLYPNELGDPHYFSNVLFFQDKTIELQAFKHSGDFSRLKKQYEYLLLRLNNWCISQGVQKQISIIHATGSIFDPVFLFFKALLFNGYFRHQETFFFNEGKRALENLLMLLEHPHISLNDKIKIVVDLQKKIMVRKDSCFSSLLDAEEDLKASLGGNALIMKAKRTLVQQFTEQFIKHNNMSDKNEIQYLNALFNYVATNYGLALKIDREVQNILIDQDFLERFELELATWMTPQQVINYLLVIIKDEFKLMHQQFKEDCFPLSTSSYSCKATVYSKIFNEAKRVVALWNEKYAFLLPLNVNALLNFDEKNQMTLASCSNALIEENIVTHFRFLFMRPQTVIQLYLSSTTTHVNSLVCDTGYLWIQEQFNGQIHYHPCTVERFLEINPSTLNVKEYGDYLIVLNGIITHFPDHIQLLRDPIKSMLSNHTLAHSSSTTVYLPEQLMIAMVSNFPEEAQCLFDNHPQYLHNFFIALNKMPLLNAIKSLEALNSLGILNRHLSNHAMINEPFMGIVGKLFSHTNDESVVKLLNQLLEWRTITVLMTTTPSSRYVNLPLKMLINHFGYNGHFNGLNKTAIIHLFSQLLNQNLITPVMLEDITNWRGEDYNILRLLLIAMRSVKESLVILMDLFDKKLMTPSQFAALPSKPLSIIHELVMRFSNVRWNAPVLFPEALLLVKKLVHDGIVTKEDFETTITIADNQRFNITWVLMQATYSSEVCSLLSYLLSQDLITPDQLNLIPTVNNLTGNAIFQLALKISENLQDANGISLFNLLIDKELITPAQLTSRVGHGNHVGQNVLLVLVDTLSRHPTDDLWQLVYRLCSLKLITKECWDVDDSFSHFLNQNPIMNLMSANTSPPIQLLHALIDQGYMTIAQVNKAIIHVSTGVQTRFQYLVDRAFEHQCIEVRRANLRLLCRLGENGFITSHQLYTKRTQDSNTALEYIAANADNSEVANLLLYLIRENVVQPQHLSLSRTRGPNRGKTPIWYLQSLRSSHSHIELLIEEIMNRSLITPDKFKEVLEQRTQAVLMAFNELPEVTQKIGCCLLNQMNAQPVTRKVLLLMVTAQHAPIYLNEKTFFPLLPSEIDRRFEKDLKLLVEAGFINITYQLTAERLTKVDLISVTSTGSLFSATSPNNRLEPAADAHPLSQAYFSLFVPTSKRKKPDDDDSEPNQNEKLPCHSKK